MKLMTVIGGWVGLMAGVLVAVGGVQAEEVDIRRFGADPKAGNDDTAAVLEAFAYMNTEAPAGSTLRFPSGASPTEYLVSTTAGLFIKRPWRLEVAPGVKIVYPHQNRSSLHVLASNTVVDNWWVDGRTRPTQSVFDPLRTSVPGILIGGGAVSVTLNNPRVENWRGAGIQCQRARQVRLVAPLISNSFADGIITTNRGYDHFGTGPCNGMRITGARTYHTGDDAFSVVSYASLGADGVVEDYVNTGAVSVDGFTSAVTIAGGRKVRFEGEAIRPKMWARVERDYGSGIIGTHGVRDVDVRLRVTGQNYQPKAGHGVYAAVLIGDDVRDSRFEVAIDGAFTNGLVVGRFDPTPRQGKRFVGSRNLIISATVRNVSETGVRITRVMGLKGALTTDSTGAGGVRLAGVRQASLAVDVASPNLNFASKANANRKGAAAAAGLLVHDARDLTLGPVRCLDAGGFTLGIGCTRLQGPIAGLRFGPYEEVTAGTRYPRPRVDTGSGPVKGLRWKE